MKGGCPLAGSRVQSLGSNGVRYNLHDTTTENFGSSMIFG